MFVSPSISPSPLIIMFYRFGGCGGRHNLNDTWSFNISTRKWTELQCTGSIPSPRASHAAVLIDDVMYVYGGRTDGKTNLGDLTAFNLSCKWFRCWSQCARSHTILSSAMDYVSSRRTESRRKGGSCNGFLRETCLSARRGIITRCTGG